MKTPVLKKGYNYSAQQCGVLTIRFASGINSTSR